jgi:hypothetical protein
VLSDGLKPALFSRAYTDGRSVLEPVLSQRYNIIHCFKGQKRRRDKIMKEIKKKKVDLKDENKKKLFPSPRISMISSIIRAYVFSIEVKSFRETDIQ